MNISNVLRSRAGELMALGLLCLTTASHAREPPALTAERYREDYSYLADSNRRTGAWWESFKWIPLDTAGRIRLNVGEDLLVDHHWYENMPFAPVEDLSGESFFLLRTSPYADLHLGANWRAFTQLVGAWTTRSPLTQIPAEETGVDVLQAFVDWGVPFKTRDSIVLRVGRQVLTYGSERLIAPGRFVRRSFDGGVAQFEIGKWRVDALWVRPVRVGLMSFDDVTDWDQALWSLYTTYSLFDFYYIGFGNQRARYHLGEGRENRHTFGARFSGAASSWGWDLEAMIQIGRLADSEIRAWALASSLRHGGFELRANAVSGDRGGGALGTFNAMFPAIRYFGYLNLIGPANLINLRPIATIRLAEYWTLRPSAAFYWRESVDDGVYGPGLNPVGSPETFGGRHIGNQWELVLEWTASRNLSFWAVYSAFGPNTGGTTQVFLLETSFQF